MPRDGGLPKTRTLPPRFCLPLTGPNYCGGSSAWALYNTFMIHDHLFVLQLFAVLWFTISAMAQQNITVDDTNPAIVYAPPGAWLLSANSSLDIGGAHMLTQNPNGTASFTFTGMLPSQLA